MSRSSQRTTPIVSPTIARNGAHRDQSSSALTDVDRFLPYNCLSKSLPFFLLCVRRTNKYVSRKSVPPLLRRPATTFAGRPLPSVCCGTAIMTISQTHFLKSTDVSNEMNANVVRRQLLRNVRNKIIPVMKD